MFEALNERLTAALKKISGRGVLRPEDVEAGLREVRLALLEADVNFKVVKEFVERVRARLQGVEVSPGLTAPQQVVKAVNAELVELFGGNSGGLRYASAPPTVILLVGLQGSGKTTTAVKLALLARREGHKPLVAGLDLRRPAAVAQLKTLADREGIAIHLGQGDVEAIAAAAIGEAQRLLCDVVVLDTAGRLQVDGELMQELKRLKAAIPVTETLLVADSMTGQEAVNVGEVFGREVGLDGVILTKLDGDARGGAALSLRVATGQRIRFAGTGEKPQDLEIFHAERMASRTLGMGDMLTLIERAERTVDKEQVVEVERRLRAGQLSFDDFLAQIRQLRAMGSLEGVLDMIPGGAAIKNQVAGADTEGAVRKMEAIILSMTKRERAHPEVIDGARRKRIALGSGVEPADVNKVLKAREAMQKLAKQFGAVNR
ncbi:MAG: signal recognition particle protein, partial [Candidatus Dormibacteraeota bacterium]|nr:signal recognition particle protein [Candidatus Dormibacteraeota bacterium]